jgi:GT2 family glycosyltransferase
MEKEKKSEKQKKRFSIIIPLGEKRSAEVLKYIEKLKYRKDRFEVLIERGKNPSANRNKAIKKAKGEYLVFLNGHSILKPDFLKQIDNFLKKYERVDIVGGPQLTYKTGKFFEKLSGIVLTSGFGAFKVKNRYVAKNKDKILFNVNENFLTSANLCVKKDVFKKIGYFNEKLWPGEDPEFIFRARKNRLNTAYNPNMVVFHRRRPNFPLFCKQMFKYGVTRPRKNKISKNTPIIFLIPMLFAIYFMFIPMLSVITTLFILPFIAYVILALLFSISDSVRGKTLIGLFVLPFLYLFLHLSYGLGMLVGYIKR